MSRKRHKPEEIVAKLRQVDVLTSQGSTVADAIRKIGVTEVIIIESWRRHDNTVRSHASLGYRPPAPEVFVPGLAARSAAQPWPAPPAARQAPARTPPVQAACNPAKRVGERCCNADASSRPRSAPLASCRRSPHPEARPVRDLCDADRANGIGNGVPLRDQNIDLAQLGNDLLRLVSLA